MASGRQTRFMTRLCCGSVMRSPGDTGRSGGRGWGSGDHAGQAAAGTRGAEEGFGDCGSQRPDTAEVLGAPRELEGMMVGGIPDTTWRLLPLAKGRRAQDDHEEHEPNQSQHAG
jgi:hypothetical protein